MDTLLRLFTLCLSPDDGGAGGTADGEKQDTGDTDPTEDKSTDGQDTTEEHQADEQIEALKQQLEELKKANSGKDKSVTKLQKELEELKKSQMSEEERKAAEQKERAEQEKKDKEAFLQDVRLLSAERAGLSEEDAVLIPGSTQEEIRDNGKRLKELLKSQFAAGMEQAKKSAMNGGTPKGGDHPPKGSTNTQLQNLFKDK